MLKLQGAIKYGQEDLPGAKSLVDQGEQDDPDTEINRGIYKCSVSSWITLKITQISFLESWEKCWRQSFNAAHFTFVALKTELGILRNTRHNTGYSIIVD